jgi:hypothetical protein
VVSSTSPVNEPGFFFGRQRFGANMLMRIEPAFFSSDGQAAMRASDEFAEAQPLRRSE